MSGMQITNMQETAKDPSKDEYDFDRIDGYDELK